jgi:hypothetical protein
MLATWVSILLLVRVLAALTAASALPTAAVSAATVLDMAFSVVACTLALGVWNGPQPATHRTTPAKIRRPISPAATFTAIEVMRRSP